jgi:hypothetical protein
VKIRTEKKSLEMRAILGKNLKEPPLSVSKVWCVVILISLKFVCFRQVSDGRGGMAGGQEQASCLLEKGKQHRHAAVED